jgi:hypothetical protein
MFMQDVAGTVKWDLLKSCPESVWDAWDFVLKEPLEAIEGLGCNGEIEACIWWFATPHVEEDGQYI